MAKRISTQINRDKEFEVLKKNLEEKSELIQTLQTQVSTYRKRSNYSLLILLLWIIVHLFGSTIAACFIPHASISQNTEFVTYAANGDYSYQIVTEITIWRYFVFQDLVYYDEEYADVKNKKDVKNIENSYLEVANKVKLKIDKDLQGKL